MRLPSYRAGLGVMAILCATGVSFFALSIPRVQASVTVNSGDLIRGQAYPAVYYMGKDGFRYVFPNDKTYFTWYSDFSGVKMIDDADLAKIQIGGNVTYKPGVKMIKIDSSPTVYAVSRNGLLRPIGSETIAKALYGNDWNKKIDDLPDGFFGNYGINFPINEITSNTTSESYYSVSQELDSAVSIDADKELQMPLDVSILDVGFDPQLIEPEIGQAIRFTNNGTTNHTATAHDGSWGTGTLKPGENFIKKGQMYIDSRLETFFNSYDKEETAAIQY